MLYSQHETTSPASTDAGQCDNQLKITDMKKPDKTTLRNIKVLIGNAAFILAAATMTTQLSAQVTVTKKGNLKVGELVQNAVSPAESPARSAVIDPGISIPVVSDVRMDSLATLCLLGPGAYSSGAYLTFGDEKNVWVGEMGDKSNTDCLQLFGKKGIVLSGNNNIDYMKVGQVASTSNQGTGAAISCLRPIYAPQFLTSSDRRLKTDIEPLNGRVSGLDALEAVSYKLRNADDGKTHFGLIAQDVQKHYPELVREDLDGNLAVDYIGLIPLLLQAYQENHAELTALRAEVSRLKGEDADEISEDVSSWLSVSSSAGNTVVAISGQQLCAGGGCIFIERVGSPMSRVVDFPAYEGNRTDVSCGTLESGVYVFSVVASDRRVGALRAIVK